MNDLFYETYCRLVKAGLCNPIHAERHGVAEEVKSSYWAIRTAWENAGCPAAIEAFIVQYADDVLRDALLPR
jgi:hypothetical protein